MTEQEFRETVEQYRQEVRGLDDAEDAEAVRDTAARLRRVGYHPLLVLGAEGFLEVRKDELERRIQEIIDLPEEELTHRTALRRGNQWDRKLECIRLLVHHFRLLVRLRHGEPEAWDEVTELYFDE